MPPQVLSQLPTRQHFSAPTPPQEAGEGGGSQQIQKAPRGWTVVEQRECHRRVLNPPRRGPENPPRAPKPHIPVLGPAPGIIGSLQALEAIKRITGLGWPLTSRLLRFTGAEAAFRTTQLSANPDCPACKGLKPGKEEL